jgi:hypothetical protein
MSGIGMEAAPSPRGLQRFTTNRWGLSRRRWDPGAPRSFEAGDTRHDRGACVGRTRRADGCAVVQWRTSCVDQNAPMRV